MVNPIIVNPIIAAGLGKLATTVGKKVAKKFVKVKDLDGFVKSLKKKKTKTKDDIDNIKKGEDLLEKKNLQEKYKDLYNRAKNSYFSRQYKALIGEKPTTISPKATVKMKARGGKVKYNVGGIVNPSFSNKFKG